MNDKNRTLTCTREITRCWRISIPSRWQWRSVGQRSVRCGGGGVQSATTWGALWARKHIRGGGGMRLTSTVGTYWRMCLDDARIELVASFENHANLLLWLENTDSGVGLHTLHTRSLHQERLDTTCCNHVDVRPPIRKRVPRISLMSPEGM